jgi:RNA polymerase primary sigma factor
MQGFQGMGEERARTFPKPMSAAQELIQARELVDLRRRLWVCLLDYPPFAGAIVGYLEASLGEDPPRAALAAFGRAAIDVRELGDRRTHQCFVVARDRLADALHTHSEEPALARALVAEVP